MQGSLVSIIPLPVSSLDVSRHVNFTPLRSETNQGGREGSIRTVGINTGSHLIHSMTGRETLIVCVLPPELNDTLSENNDTVGQIVHYIMKNEGMSPPSFHIDQV